MTCQQFAPNRPVGVPLRSFAYRSHRPSADPSAGLGAKEGLPGQAPSKQETL